MEQFLSTVIGILFLCVDIEFMFPAI